jgi:AAA-like domain
MSSSTAKTTTFFTVGGTLRPDDPSYVVRVADRILEEQLRIGVFCAILTARQMGKSSLMVRIARRLVAQGTRCAVVDLTAIGTKVAADGWYLGVLAPIRNQLRLTVDLAAWWAEHEAMGRPERFALFLRDVALAQGDTPLVIFIDEIDTTLALDARLRDDFFVAIRAIANERANTPTSSFTRLTFAFFGVATPDDLVGDRRRTAFNIGVQIQLDDLSLHDASPFQAGLESAYPGNGTRILQQIFEWTGGHPYLTQKLCAAAVRTARQPNDEHIVDKLIHTQVLDEGANDDNLAFVRSRISGTPIETQRDLLTLYSRVLRGDLVRDDESSIIQNQLELTGLVKVVDGQLVVRNQIYRTAFDQDWVRAAKPHNNRQRLAVASVIIAAVVVLVVIFGLWLSPTDEDARAQTLADGFIATLAKKPSADTPADHQQRLDSLDQLLQLQHDQGKYRELVLNLFYDRLSFDRQQGLFKLGGASDGSKLIRVVRAIAATLGPEDDGSDLKIINAIITGIHNVGPNQTDTTRSSLLALEHWLQLRQALRSNNLTAAQQMLITSTLPLSSTILGTKAEPVPAYAFDIARAWATDTSPDSRALAALQSMLNVAASQPTPLPVTIVVHTPNITFAGTPHPSALVPPNNTPVELSTSVVIVTPEIATIPLPTTSISSSNPVLQGNGLRQTDRFRNRQQILQTIRTFLRANPVLLQALAEHREQYVQLADILGVASVPTAGSAPSSPLPSGNETNIPAEVPPTPTLLTPLLTSPITPSIAVTATAPATTPSPTPCNSEIAGIFGQLYQSDAAIRISLGCALGSPRIGDTAIQYYPNGTLYWAQSQPVLFVFYGETEGTWQTIRFDTDAELAYNCPDGTYIPVRGFKQALATHPQIADKLGQCAITPEEPSTPNNNGVVQRFQRGLILSIEATVSTGESRIWVLLNNGTFRRFKGPSTP